MKFSCDTKALHTALQLVSTVIPAKSPREILQNVLIEAKKGGVHLAGTDLEVGIRFNIPDIAVEEEGTILTEAARLTQILREASGDVVSIESQESSEFTLSYEGSNYELKGWDPEEFPEVPEFEGDHVQIDAHLLTNMIAHTAFAAARESIRFAINGVLFVVKDGEAQMVGCDGHRLAWIRKNVEIASEVEFKGIIPLKALGVMQRLIAEAEEPVQLKLEENFILMRCGEGVIASKLVEGSYPNYEEVVPRDNDRIAEVAVNPLMSAVRQAAVLTGDESQAIRAVFDDGTLTMTARLPERGGAKIKRPINYEGEPVKIGFNPTYLLDVLKVVDTDNIKLELKDKDRPAVLKEGTDYQYVVMPVSIED